MNTMSIPLPPFQIGGLNYAGVYWCVLSKKWVTYTSTYDHKTETRTDKQLGSFDDIIKAANAYERG